MNKVSAKELRRMFNTMMLPRLRAGELQVVRKKRVRARSPGLEPGTQSETIYLIERATNLRVAGLRQGELFGLTWDRVQTLRRELVVDRQLLTPSNGPCTFGPPKSRRSTRIVPVPAAAVEALAEHRRAFGDGQDGLVFATRAG